MRRLASAGEIELQAEGFDDDLAYKKVKFRGQIFHMQELPLNQYRAIEKKATVTKDNGEGVDVEILDNALQDVLMMKASMVSPRPGEPGYKEPGEMGTKLFLALRRVVQGLHFGNEVDELRAKKKGEEKEPEEEGADEGNE